MRRATRGAARDLRVARAEDQVHRQARQIRAIMPLVEKYDGEFWKSVVDRVQVRIDHYKADRAERFMKMSEVELKVNVAQELELLEVLSLPETAKALLARMQEDHAQARAALLRLKERSKL